jgi:hypothetical protein
MRRWFARGASAAWLLLAVVAAPAAPPVPQPKSIWLEVAPADSEETATLSSMLLLELQSSLERQGFSIAQRQEEADPVDVMSGQPRWAYGWQNYNLNRTPDPVLSGSLLLLADDNKGNLGETF